MKKISVLLVAISVLLTALPTQKAESQTTQNPTFLLSTFKFKPTPSNPTSAISNTSADTTSLYLPGYYNIVALQPVYTRNTGTAAGTVIIYGSINGVNFYPTGDTMAVTNQATNTQIFTHLNPPWVYYRSVASGGTTVTATVQTYYTARRL